MVGGIIRMTYQYDVTLMYIKYVMDLLFSNYLNINHENNIKNNQ